MSRARQGRAERLRLEELAAANPVVVVSVIDRAIAGVEWQKKRDQRLYGEHCLTVHHVELLAAKQAIVDLQAVAARCEELLVANGYSGHAELLHSALARTQGACDRLGPAGDEYRRIVRARGPS